MFQKSMKDLRGRHAAPLLVSVACVVDAAPQRDRLLVNLSPAQLHGGAGAWSMEGAASWLENRRLCSSSREVVGMGVEALDGTAGRVADMLVDDEQWSVEYLLVNALPAAGGRLLVPLDWVESMDRARRAVYLRRTREELRRLPSP